MRVSGDVSTGFDSPALLPIVPVAPGGIDLFLLLSVWVIIPGCREPKSDELQTRSSYRGRRPTVTAPCKRERRHRGGCLLTRGRDGGETTALPGGEKAGDTSPPSPWSLRKPSPSHEASPGVSRPVSSTASETVLLFPAVSGDRRDVRTGGGRREVNSCSRPRGSQGEASALVPPSTGKRRWRLRCLMPRVLCLCRQEAS